MTLLDTLNRIADRLDEIADKLDGKATPQSSQTFDEFARYYFDTFRKRKVKPETMRADIYRYNAHICPAIGETPLTALTPTKCKTSLTGSKTAPKRHTKFLP